MRAALGRLAIAVLPGLLAGCLDTHASLKDESLVAAAVRERVGLVAPANRLRVPDTVSLDDGLSEAEAAQLALCNNAQFQELLADLGLALGDLVAAGLLPNPEVVYYFPAGAKPFKYLVELPVEAIVLRPTRVQAANAEWERTRERLTQAGLDLVRDTRLAYADWTLVRDRVLIAEENRQLRDRILTLTEARLKAGEATPLEVSAAKIDSLRAQQEATRAANDVPIAEERLRNLMGLGLFRPAFTPQASEPPSDLLADVESLTAEAISSRPDVLSSQRAIEAAAARVRLAKLGWLRILGIGDATSGGNGHEFSSAIRAALPIFNWNQGGIARAAADHERLVRQRQTVRERAVQEVRQAHAQFAQAAADHRMWTEQIRPAVDEAVRRADNTYKEGGASLLLVLETSRQLIDTRAREAQLRADLSRSWAELERSVGRKLGASAGEFAADRAPMTGTP